MKYYSFVFAGVAILAYTMKEFFYLFRPDLSVAEATALVALAFALLSLTWNICMYIDAKEKEQI